MRMTTWVEVVGVLMVALHTMAIADGMASCRNECSFTFKIRSLLSYCNG